MSDADVPFPSELSDSLIIIRWSPDEGRPTYDLGEMDEWSAATVLRRVVARIEDNLAYPRDVNEAPDEDD